MKKNSPLNTTKKYLKFKVIKVRALDFSIVVIVIVHQIQANIINSLNSLNK